MRAMVVVGAVALAVGTGEAVAGDPDWVSSQSVDGLTDVVTYRTALSVGVRSIAITCRSSGATTVSFVTPEHLSATPSPRLVSYRFDNGPVQQDDWTYVGSASLTAATITGPRALAFVEDLRRARRLRLRLSSTVAAPEDFDADISGSDAAITSLFEQCGVRAPSRPSGE
jgi:hypothetical protein